MTETYLRLRNYEPKYKRVQDTITNLPRKLYSLQNPKNFRTCESFKFRSQGSFIRIKQLKNFRTRPSFVRQRRKICDTETLGFLRLYTSSACSACSQVKTTLKTTNSPKGEWTYWKHPSLIAHDSVQMS